MLQRKVIPRELLRKVMLRERVIPRELLWKVMLQRKAYTERIA